MFDAIASRYELVNKLMTFGLDARGAGARSPTCACRRRASCSTSPRAPVTSPANSPARVSARSPPTSATGCCAPAATMSDRVQADASALPFRSGGFDGVTCGYALRNFTDLAAHLRRDGARDAPRRSPLPARGRRAALGALARRLSALVPPRRALHWLARLGPRGLPLPARSPPRTCPSSDEIARMLNRSGFSAVNHRRVMGGLSQQFIATRSA